MKSVPETLFRDLAANERTVLAWIRTGVALMAFGFAIARFGLFLREIAEVRGVGQPPMPGLGSGWFGVAMVVLGLVTNVAATIRYIRIRKALETHEQITMSSNLVYVIGFGSVLVALAMAVILSRAI
jgi:putative membrane protein